ncbi:MAG: PBP1A family penicillin-binding protein [Patescibacteria group bacterium]|nr:PBP1A family penicillin-binding protein [Patescibacteria group bacterium]
MPKRKYFREVYQKRRGYFWVLVKIIGTGLLFLFLLGIGFFIYSIKDLPRPEKFSEGTIYQTTKIYDRTGKILLNEIYGEEKRTLVPLSKIPEYLKLAVITAEDKNFYQHQGLDFRAILRAILYDLKLKKPIQGASTISQQLIRSYFLTRKKILKRKSQEIILTLELERRYPKEQILEWYLNLIPFGGNLYGVEEASQTFFQKSVSDVSLPEGVILASLIKAPSYLSPYGPNLDQLQARKNYILNKMVEEKYLTEEEKIKAQKEEIVFYPKKDILLAPHFVMSVREELEEKYGKDFLIRKGLRVYTTLDFELQQLAEKVVKEGAKNNEKYQAFNAALVAINPKTGEILALVGSKDYFGKSYPNDCQIEKNNCLFSPQFNVATQGERQPGSAFKPFVYLTAFKKGYSDQVIVVDEETNFGIWGGKPYIPKNYDGKFRGPVTLREALSQSLNVPSVKVLSGMAGLADSIKTAKEFGITTLNKPANFYGLALVLGGGEVKLLDMVSAYAVFATEGLKVPPSFILRVLDLKGEIIEENKKTPQRIVEVKYPRMINDILTDNEARAPIFGWRSLLYFEDFEVAVKTGTTQNFKDGWIIGYTPSLVVGVWVGNNNNSPINREPGIVVAGPIWRAFLERALLKYPKEKFEKP